ncbi:MAG: T9SS type A sorting domain-containing protein [Mongoliitalea sp.]
MVFQKKTYQVRIESFLRIYRILGFFCVLSSLHCNPLFAQIPLTIGDYRTIASGDYQDIAIWEMWDGFSWIGASAKPSAGNSIFIDQGHEVRLVQQEEANHVYLFSAASPGRKLNLQNFELHVYGALRGLQSVGGLFEINTVSSPVLDWIYPETGRIVFKGSSRIVVDRASWSANTTNSRYTVVFDPDPGQIFTVNSAFKANAFIVQSGTVVQTVNTAGIPACSTFSFNNQAIFNGAGPYGDFIIEPGARLLSECSAPLASIIQRSAAVPGALFHLKAGASLFLSGNEPLIDVVNFQLEGNVYYVASSGVQRMLRNTMAGASIPKNYHNLLFENGAQKILQDSIFLDGDLAVLSGDFPTHGNGFVRFYGSGEQQLVGPSLQLNDVELLKTGGSLRFSGDLLVDRLLYMRSGTMDFEGKDLYLNESGLGGLQQFEGVWVHLHRLYYRNLPSTLTARNATFPLKDSFQGGIRRFRLAGESPGGTLELQYMEIPGANWDPDFDDSDGTPILYQLNSYVLLSGLSEGSSTIEMRMAAENLVVDQVEDLRIVSNGQAAPGNNLLAIDNDTLWARREVPFSLLNNQTFTIGSYRVLSVLPLRWHAQSANWFEGHVKINWQTLDEKNTSHFVIWKATAGVDAFEVIGQVKALGKEVNTYEWSYVLRLPHERTFYQLEQVDKDGQRSFSKVFRLEGVRNKASESTIVYYPNPYTDGALAIEFPSHWNANLVYLQVSDVKGQDLFNGRLSDFDASLVLSNALKGVYFFCLKGPDGDVKTFKLLKN